jgi:hypothetical protein
MVLVPRTCQTQKDHFTYCESKGDIKQGDVIGKGPEIEEALRSHFAFFNKPEFRHFIVLTQSCDLVRYSKSNKICKAPYITLSPAMDLEKVLEEEISYWRNDLAIAAGVCKESDRQKAIDLTKRIMNNNNPEYFYLHQSVRQGIEFPNNSCALLRLSFSVRSEDFYDICLRNRILSLKDVFSAKLGFLISEIYSRVGTEDWPDNFSPEFFDEFVEETLGGIFMWVPGDKLTRLEKELRKESKINDPDKMNRDYLRDRIKDISDKGVRFNEAVDRIIEILEDGKLIEADPQQIEHIRAVLLGDKTLHSYIKR